MEKKVNEELISKDTRNIIENISAIFLIPCLKISQESRDKFIQMGYTNSYMYWEKHMDTNGEYKPLYLLFKPAEFNLKFYLFSSLLEKNQNHVETVDLSDGSVVFVFKIPRRFLKDYERFKEGKYSKFSPEFKACFPQMRYVVGLDGKIKKDQDGRFITEPTIFYHIFNKTLYMQNVLREVYGDDIELPDELYEKYRPEREVLK